MIMAHVFESAFYHGILLVVNLSLSEHFLAGLLNYFPEFVLLLNETAS